MPEKAVAQIVNDKIITADKKACDYILTKLYEDNLKSDEKASIIAHERIKLRMKLKERHN